MKKPAITFVCLVACTVGEDGSYNNPPAEPELTTQELSILPAGLEPEHHADLEAALARELPQDDAASFDDADVTRIVDEPVEDGPGPASFQPLLASGLHPRASDALRAAGVAAWRITQTIGNAPASAGTHARDGYVNGLAYTAAVDLSVSGMTAAQIVNLLERLAKLGYAGWYRQNGADGWSGANHIHAVYANCAMKASLRSQVRSWLAGRNGLVSNTTYRFHTFSDEAKAAVKGKFAMSNEGTSNGGAGISGRVNTDGTPLMIRPTAGRTGAPIGSIADGAYVTITCQTRGESLTGTYGTTTLWDRVGTGFVSDAFVSTGSDGQVAPSCP